MAAMNKKHWTMANTMAEDLRQELREAVRLHHCEHDHDFNTQVSAIIEDLGTMAEKYKDMLQALYAEPTISDEQVSKTVHALLEQLPAGYYQLASFTKTVDGYMLQIDHTIIYRDATAEEAIKHTTHYVEERKKSPTLPIGVIYGVYD